MGYRDQVWRISPPQLGADGWTYLLTGRAGARRVGPFRSERAAIDHQHQAFQRWRCRARQLGGWAPMGLSPVRS